jgi:hypothetical protein
MSKVRSIAWLAAFASLCTVAACSSSAKPEASSPSSTTADTTASAEPVNRVIVGGEATLDGKPVDSRWVGAVVLDHGLVTPCQTALPSVANGVYSVSVFTERASAGCGRPGSEIALWVVTNDQIVFSTNTVAWPADTGVATNFDATYEAADPKGATPDVAQFQGGAFAADGTAVPPGTRVEAYVGDTRCGVASVRTSQGFTGYILSVVGPDSVAGCTLGAPIEFRVGGARANPTDIENTPPGRNDTLDLRVA